MTSPDHRTSPRRRLSLLALLALLVTASLGLVGWSLTSDEGTRTAGPAPETLPAAPPDRDPPAAAPSPTTTAAAQVRLVTLPVPEDAPADAYADTPYVVHGTLALPTLGVSQPLHEGVTLTAINHGPSHWPGTAMPGQLGNVVVAGHRTTYSKPFYDLDLLQPGDPLVFTMNDGTTWTYELTETTLVGPDAMHIVNQTAAHTATLFACHPKGSAAQRIVAHFRLVPTAP